MRRLFCLPCFQKTVKELVKIHNVVGGEHLKNVRSLRRNLVGSFVFIGRSLHFVRFPPFLSFTYLSFLCFFPMVLQGNSQPSSLCAIRPLDWGIPRIQSPSKKPSISASATRFNKSVQ